MKVFLGSDHAGYDLKQQIIPLLQGRGVETQDLGCHSTQSCDYPEFGTAVAKAVVAEQGSLGIVVCGSGVGISMAANKVQGARCVLANSVELATGGRQHNGANILALGARTTMHDPLPDIINTFLDTPPDPADRHVRRREQLDKL